MSKEIISQPDIARRILYLRKQKVSHCIRKDLTSASRLDQQRQFARREFDSLRATYLNERPLDPRSHPFGKEPFASVHRRQR